MSSASMGARRWNRWIAYLIVGSCVGVLPPMGVSQAVVSDADHLPLGQVIHISDTTGQEIDQSGRAVNTGDEIIQEDGRHWRIESVSGAKATAKLIGKEDWNAIASEVLSYNHSAQDTLPVQAKSAGVVAIYHTHSDEAYIPGDGAPNIPAHGGIYKVGAAFKAAMEKVGLKVTQSQARFDPHDDTAYLRSRPTARILLRTTGAAALFDVHRDGIPDPAYYAKTVDGQNVAQVRLVVGRQNPKMYANLQFAKRLMAISNKQNPGIVKEIFMAKGNYNQDLSDRALLIEAGTHTSARSLVQKGISILATSIPTVIGVPKGAAPGAPTAARPDINGAGNSGALVWILVLAVLGGGAFLVFSTGGWDKAKEKISQFGTEELGSPLGTNTSGTPEDNEHKDDNEHPNE